MRRFELNIPKDLWEYLSLHKEVTGVPTSVFIRQLIKQHQTDNPVPKDLNKGQLND